jgi:hypothetical protein
MGSFKTDEMKQAKRLQKISERKLLEQEASEAQETKLPLSKERIIRRPAAQDPGIVTFGQQSLRQKKG